MEHIPEPSPETENGPDRKRRRKILSCISCRSRKVQCDRGLPSCSRCTKAGKAESCVYEDDPPPASNGSVNGSQHRPAHITPGQASSQVTVTVSKDVWDDLLSRLLQQERIIEGMRNERKDVTISSGSRMVSSLPRPNDSASTVNPSKEFAKESMLFRGKGFRTQFHGPSDIGSLITHVPETFEYVREVFARSPAVVRCRKELRTLRDIAKIVDKQERAEASKSLMGFLPDRDRADAMIELYLNSIDSTYGILHVPSFRRDHEAFRLSPGSAQPAFLVTMLLMIACVECFMEEGVSLYVADSPLPRERAIKIVRACEAWVGEQSQKHTTLAYYQIHCLILIAKEVNGIKTKRRWVDSGHLLRLCVSAGMHRDSDLSMKKTSKFDREMRKRIWSFIVEIDIQASIDRGMPTVSENYLRDCELPLNLRDEDFDETTEVMPDSRPDSELTKMSFLRLSGESRSLRSTLTNFINAPQAPLNYEDVLSYTQELERCIKKLPGWTGSESPGTHANSSAEEGVALLHIQLEQYLLLLHCWAARTVTTETAASFSKTAFLCASNSILSKISELTTTGRRFLLLHRHDVIRIFVSVGYMGTLPSRSFSAANAADQSKAWLEIADSALVLFEDRIMRIGHMQWAFCWAVRDILRRRVTAPVSEPDPTSGCDRARQLFEYMLENQEPSFAMKAATHEEGLPSGLKYQELAMSNASMESGATQGMANSLAQPALDSSNFLLGNNTAELPDWNFEDLMMYNDVFWS